MKRCTKLCLGVLPFGAMGAVGVVLIGTDLEPAGWFEGYAISNHHKRDVLSFGGGEVRLLTCCGDETVGTYTAAADGQWRWTWPPRRDGSSESYLLRCRPLDVDVRNERDPSERYWLRRRLTRNRWW